MIDYDSFSRCHLTDIFFAFHAGAKELKRKPDVVAVSETKLEENMIHSNIELDQGLPNYSPWAKSGPPSPFCNCKTNV